MRIKYHFVVFVIALSSCNIPSNKNSVSGSGHIQRSEIGVGDTIKVFKSVSNNIVFWNILRSDSCILRVDTVLYKVPFDTKNNVANFDSDSILPEYYNATETCFGGDDEVKKLFQSFPEGIIKRIKLTEEARILADKYIRENVVGKASRADCQHIAMATINRADVLVSWNFKHIVNLERIRGYNAVNFKEGYQMTEIRTPKEIFSHED